MIKHLGTQRPVPRDWIVTVRSATGEDTTGPAGTFMWGKFEDPDGQIVEYRVETEKSCACPEGVCWGAGRIPEGQHCCHPSVGDLSSTVAGSGARFNGGKPPLELIPARVISGYLRWRENSLRPPLLAPDWQHVLSRIGEFQMGGDLAELHTAAYWCGADWAAAARVFDYGRRHKYAAWNWAKGMAWSIPIGCAMRHAMALSSGEIDDPESGESHAGHIMCNLIMLMWYLFRYPAGDDRFTPPPVAA